MPATPFDLDAYISRSEAVDIPSIPWDQVPAHPLSADAVRALRYMQDIESHTIIYLRTLLDTRVIDDPEVATFLACWLYEETFHGIALARFVRSAGHPLELRPRSAMTVKQTIEARLTSWLAWAWPDFVAVHMVWGAINELTALTAYRRLGAVVDHPVLRDLLDRIARDESRHFYFYFKQAERRLGHAGAARVARTIVERFWGPVGSGVQPLSETRFLARYLFSGPDGLAAVRKVDTTIRDLPGFADIPLLEAWIDRTEPGVIRSDETWAPARAAV